MDRLKSALVQKANPYHDPKTGRFTFSPSGKAKLDPMTLGSRSGLFGYGTREQQAADIKAGSEQAMAHVALPSKWKGHPFPTLMEGVAMPPREDWSAGLIGSYLRRGDSFEASQAHIQDIRIRILEANRLHRLKVRQDFRDKEIENKMYHGLRVGLV